MEALVILFAELIAACLMPAFALLGVLLGLFVELLAFVFGGVFASWADKRRKAQARAQSQAQAQAQGATSSEPRKPLIPRKYIHWGAGLLGAVGIIGILGAKVYFEPVLRFVLDKAEDRTGMSVTFEAASGDLLRGQVALSNVHLVRQPETGLAFDLKVQDTRVDVSLPSLLFGTPRIELGMVAGVSGYVALPERAPKQAKQSKPRKRGFRADQLKLSDVEIDIHPLGQDAYQVEIPQAEVTPFSSRFAAFDLLFRSNLEMVVAGQRLLVETREITEFGRKTTWQFENVEASKLGQIVPKAPLTWARAGQVDVAVNDRWSLSDNWIEMDWAVRVRELELAVPKSAGASEKVIGWALSKVVKSKGGTADFEYSLRMDRDTLTMETSDDLGAFWDLALGALLEKYAPDQDKKETKSKLKGALEKAQGLLKSRDN